MPPALTFQCPEDVPQAGPLTALDECQGPVTAVGIDTNNGGAGCANDPLIITRTWTFDDGCGNTSSVRSSYFGKGTLIFNLNLKKR